MKNFFFDCAFFDTESFFHASFPCCNLVCAFAAVFSEKSPILGTKVAKTSFFFGIFECFSWYERERSRC